MMSDEKRIEDEDLDKISGGMGTHPMPPIGGGTHPSPNPPIRPSPPTHPGLPPVKDPP
jgi:hypothetical protein